MTVNAMTNPLTGLPYGDAFWSGNTWNGTPLSDLDQAAAAQAAGLGVFTQLLSEPTRTLMTDWDSGNALVNQDVHMLALAGLDPATSTPFAASNSYLDQLLSEANAVHGNALATGFQPELDAAYQDAVDVATRQAKFDAARFGLDPVTLRENAIADVRREYNQIEGPTYDDADLRNWASSLPIVHQGGQEFGEADLPMGETGSLISNLTPAQASAQQSSAWGGLNQILSGVGEGVELGTLGDAMAAQAAKGLNQRKSAGQIRREFASQFNAVPLSALEGEEFATFTSPAAGQKAFRGRIA
jgi:hypothetical protein